MTKKSTLFLYFAYCLSAILFQVIIKSVYSFFHFLLDHDLGIVENALRRNAWEIIMMAKVLALYVAFSLHKLTVYSELNLVKTFKSYFFVPRSSTWTLGIFLLFSYFFATQTYIKEISYRSVENILFYPSFIGGVVFFFVDFLFIAYFVKNRETSNSWKLLLQLFALFLITTKILMPYLVDQAIFLLLHVVVLFTLLKNFSLSDVVVYLFLVVAPINAFFGQDLIWGMSESVMTYQGSIPLLAIILLWSVGLGYLRFTRTN